MATKKKSKPKKPKKKLAKKPKPVKTVKITEPEPDLDDAEIDEELTEDDFFADDMDVI